MSMAPQDYRPVLDFWFGEITGGWAVSRPRELWFRSTAEHDREIAGRFGGTVREVAGGLWRDWMGAPDGALAAAIVLDQFPRNVFRGTAGAFAHDGTALEVALHAIGQGFDRRLEPIQRMFLYLPLEHSERAEMQELSVEKFRLLADGAPAAHREDADDSLRYAIAHRDIIARFGRFPHRNGVLGRDSTPEERAYLDGGGETFGQAPRAEGQDTERRNTA